MVHIEDMSIESIEKHLERLKQEKEQSKDWKKFDDCKVGTFIKFSNHKDGPISQIISSSGVEDKYTHNGKAVVLLTYCDNDAWGCIADGYIHHVRKGDFTVIPNPFKKEE